MRLILSLVVFIFTVFYRSMSVFYERINDDDGISYSSIFNRF